MIWYQRSSTTRIGQYEKEFKNIVHYEKIRRFNSVNLLEGYKPIEIFSPREVVHYES